MVFRFDIIGGSVHRILHYDPVLSVLARGEVSDARCQDMVAIRFARIESSFDNSDTTVHGTSGFLASPLTIGRTAPS